MSNTMKKSILFVSMLSISMLVWNCGGAEDGSSKKKLTNSQKAAADTLGVNPTDYENAINGDSDSMAKVLTKVLTRPTSQNGIGMSKQEVTNLSNYTTETEQENALLVFVKKVAVYIFGAGSQPANLTNGQPNTRRAANDAESVKWLKEVFHPTSEGIEFASPDHLTAFERLFGDNGGKSKNGAIHTHNDATSKFPTYTMFILLTLLLEGEEMGPVLDTIGAEL